MSIFKFFDVLERLVNSQNNLSKFEDHHFRADPIEPTGRRPKSILDEILVSEQDVELYEDFDGFADKINTVYSLAAPWRLDECPNAEHRLLGIDDPSYGPKYVVFYNDEEVGTLEFGTDIIPEPKQKFACIMEIAIRAPRMIPYAELHDLLHTLCLTACFDTKRRFEQAIPQSMMEALWDPGIDDFELQTLNFSWSGSYVNFMDDK